QPERVGARRSAEAAEWRLRERSGVEPFQPRALVAWQVAILTGYQVGARADSRASRVHVVGHRRGETALESYDGRKLPAVEQPPRSAVRIFEERQLIEHRLYEALRDIETVYRTIGTQKPDPDRSPQRL